MDHPLVLVRWLDSWFDFDMDSDRDDYINETVGFRIRDDPKVISVAQERLPDGRFRAVTHIPRVCVLITTELA